MLEFFWFFFYKFNAQLRLPGAFLPRHAPGTDQRGPGICDASTVRVVLLQVTLGFIIVPLKVEILHSSSLSHAAASGLSGMSPTCLIQAAASPHWLRISPTEFEFYSVACPVLCDLISCLLSASEILISLIFLLGFYIRYCYEENDFGHLKMFESYCFRS